MVHYKKAIVIIKKRFGNKQLATNKHMDVFLGIPSQSYGGLLCSMLMNKLPRDLRILMSRDIKNDNWDHDRLLGLLEAEVEAREKASSSSTTTDSSSNSHRDQKSKYRGRQLPSAAVLKMDSSPTTCTNCHGSHTSNSCQTVSNVTARKDILRKGGRCFLCLKKNHLCVSRLQL